MFLLIIILVISFLQVLLYKLVDLFNLKYGRLLALTILIAASFFMLSQVMAIKPPPGASKCGNGQMGAFLLFGALLPLIFLATHLISYTIRKLFNH